MSHSRTEIEPARGLTVLIGPNNCGKSAVVSALQTLCSNVAGNFMVRHDERDCRVTIETDDEHTVTWRRHRDTVSYIIDGREVHRLGAGGTPDDLDAVLRLPKVKSEDGNDKFDIHFGTQKSPIFLLDESERRAAMFFASSSDAEYLMRMQKRHQEKVRDAKRDRDKLTELLAKWDVELTVLAPIGELSNTLQTVVEKHATILQQEQLLSRLENDFKQLNRQSITLARQVAELDCLSDLNQPPAMVSVEPLAELIEQLFETESWREVEASRAGVLTDLPSPPTLAKTEALEEVWQQLIDAMRISHFEQQRAGTTAKLAEPPVLADTTTLQELCDALPDAIRLAAQLVDHLNCLHSLRTSPALADATPLEALFGDWRMMTKEALHLHERHAALERLTEPPVLSDLVQLEACVTEFSAAVIAAVRMMRGYELLANLTEPPLPQATVPLTTLLESCAAAQAQIDTHEAQLTEVSGEIQSIVKAVSVWTDANPVCLTCGAAVDPERLLTWGHRHD
ncbi:MAG: AAA family ATPase [Planctomycetales bacterium]|nr:AAA family ATPase [Planctomycetales bacterium]